MLIFKVGASLQCVLWGFHFGHRKSEMWAVSVLVVIFLDAIIVETIHVLVHAWFVNIFLGVSNQDHPSSCGNDLVGSDFYIS